jgi:hypothetical protein
VDLQQALTQMHAADILMRARGDRLSVASRAPLTDQQRAWIRAHKVELLRLLGGAVSASPKPTAEDQEANAGRAAGCGPDGGESREAAALQVRHAMRVYRYRLTDKPDTWLTMIAPDCDLEDARRSLRLRFGERLTAVYGLPLGCKHTGRWWVGSTAHVYPASGMCIGLRYGP